jgi:ribonuclease HI
MKSMGPEDRLILYIDGASRGNPGRAGAGIWITNGGGEKISEVSRYLGHKTNNQAEYWALLLGLKEAKHLGGEALQIFTDSELVERQIKGIYRVKDSNLKGLHKTVLQNLKTFSSFEIESIPREENKEADRLANQAIRRRIANEKRKGGGEGEQMVAPPEFTQSGKSGGEESPSSTGQGGP